MDPLVMEIWMEPQIFMVHDRRG